MNNASREVLAEQWEVAKRVYAWHQVMSAQSGVLRADAAERLNKVAAQFRALGGVVKVGKDALGIEGPRLELSDGTLVPYSAGLALVDDFAQSLFS